MDVLDLRQLNRATLARQLLLERCREDVATVVRRCGGIQAQGPSQSVIGLWSRIEGFSKVQLVESALAGRVVRGTTLRGTLHLHDVDDYRAIRMSIQPVLDTYLRGLRRRLPEELIDAVVDAGRTLLDAGPRSVAELKRELIAAFPGRDVQGLNIAPRLALALLVVPDAHAADGWRSNVAPFVRAEQLIGGQLAPASDELLVRRFFEALGPGSPADVQAWCGVRGLASTITAMLRRGELIELTTFDGDQLLDLPDAPRPDGEAPAGVRFLPMWDNLLLSHKDRSRIIDPRFKPYIASKNGMPPATYLVDGFVHGTWRIQRAGRDVTLQLSPFGPIPGWAQEPLVGEGNALLAFLEPEAATRTVRLG